jgi:hypothetical protein
MVCFSKTLTWAVSSATEVSTMLPLAVSWTDMIIDGRKCASTNIGHKRLYVAERFGKVEAWIDGVRIGNYIDLDDAKTAAVKIRPTNPKLRPL